MIFSKKKFMRIWKAITTKSYISYSHPKDLEEFILNVRSNIQEFFRIMSLRIQRMYNHDWVKCPLQDTTPVFVYSQEKFRWLRESNGDRTCEFCGSWHPDEFIAFLDKVIETEAKECAIEVADGRDKIYVSRPNIHNASEGAIKFKIAHLTQEQYKENFEKINKAAQLSYAKLKR